MGDGEIGDRALSYLLDGEPGLATKDALSAIVRRRLDRRRRTYRTTAAAVLVVAAAVAVVPLVNSSRPALQVAAPAAVSRQLPRGLTWSVVSSSTNASSFAAATPTAAAASSKYAPLFDVARTGIRLRVFRETLTPGKVSVRQLAENGLARAFTCPSTSALVAEVSDARFAGDAVFPELGETAGPIRVLGALLVGSAERSPLAVVLAEERGDGLLRLGARWGREHSSARAIRGVAFVVLRAPHDSSLPLVLSLRGRAFSFQLRAPRVDSLAVPVSSCHIRTTRRH